MRCVRPISGSMLLQDCARLDSRTNPYTNSNFEALRVAEFARTPLCNTMLCLQSGILGIQDDTRLHHHFFFAGYTNDGFSRTQVFKGHMGATDSVFLEELSLFSSFSSEPAPCEAISRVAFHPKIPVVATACDDHTWKMWSMPEGLQDHSCRQ